MAKHTKYKDLLITTNSTTAKLHQIVLKAIEEEQLISQKLLKKTDEVPQTIGEKMADKVATFGGSWKFIIIFTIFLIIWMGFNVIALSDKGFDPYPFILLNLILSSIAALQAPVIMMSQNRKEERDRERAEDDYMVNLKSEIEIRNLHDKVDLLISEQMKNLFEIQQMQLNQIENLNKQFKAYQKDN